MIEFPYDLAFISLYPPGFQCRQRLEWRYGILTHSVDDRPDGIVSVENQDRPARSLSWGEPARILRGAVGEGELRHRELIGMDYIYSMPVHQPLYQGVHGEQIIALDEERPAAQVAAQPVFNVC